MKKIRLILVMPLLLNASEKTWLTYYVQGRPALKKQYNEPSVRIQTNDREEVKVPASFVQKLGTLANMQQEVGPQENIPLNAISSSQLRTVLALIESSQDHPQLTGQKLYEAMGKDVHIDQPIEVLKAANYLDIQPPADKPVINFLAQQIADEQDYPRWKPRRNIPLMEQLKDFGGAKYPYGALVARYYFLRTGKNLPNLPQEVLNNENYAFSVRDYLDHKATHSFLREKFGDAAFAQFPTRFDRIMPMGGNDSLSRDDDGVISKGTNGALDLSELNINDIEGINEYKPYMHPAYGWRVKAIYLDHNKIKSLTKPNSFSAYVGFPEYDYTGVTALVFSNNKITEVNPMVFNNLPRLRVVDLRNNPLSQENKQQLRTAHPNIQFRF